MTRRRGTRRRRGRAAPSLLRRWAARLVRTLVALCLAALAVGAIFVAATWPELDHLARGPVTTSAFMEAFEARAHRRPPMTWRPYEEIDDDLKLAVLVAEDARFFDHGPFDWRELSEAVRDRVEGGRRLRGASTLTQQLAKNLWLSPQRSVFRKAREAILAVALERRLSKERILEIYLNVVELGPGVFGAEAAAIKYFGHSADDLTAEEAAQLAAGLSQPARWHPGVEAPRYVSRVQHILQEMVRSPDVARRIAGDRKTH